MPEAEFQVNGTLIWYYYICKRQVWLMAHALGPDQEDNNIYQGRTIHEFSYQRDKKEINLGNVKIDLVRSEKGQLVIGEIKKSSKFLTSATRQLQFYLWQIEQMGIAAGGELFIPEEKQRIEVTLDEEARLELETATKEIIDIVEKAAPPPAQKIKWCKPCAYAEFCWA
ncbi:MAG TPA: CRISPR-associated protein Cas4 [Syntrophomonas sp.]|jgi:CRISPR-associated exonuclease Cas4|uniref:CRISPR-associated protein Cas4 n=1 Tax=Syntrophomonas wolfei TaxID=863 RepID=UPI000E92E14E|nr:CRISPR-associated protein Cas4 [Syntrophomonas wolfei]HBQ87011.1 CRISPR-associated protein Cas4 [Syntrophomonas sp.]